MVSTFGTQMAGVGLQAFKDLFVGSVFFKFRISTFKGWFNDTHKISDAICK